MPERIQKHKQATKREQTVEEASPTAEKADHTHTDELLAEIDEALGENLENAQAFIAANVQKGGE